MTRHGIAILLLTVAAVSPAAAQRAACKPVPVASTRSLPPYPPISLGLGEQGTTELDVTVVRNGHAGSVKVIKSSGFARLDQTASAHVRQNYLWLPMPCASAKTSVRVRWESGRILRPHQQLQAIAEITFQGEQRNAL